VAFAIVGFCKLLLKAFGPLHVYEVAALTVKLIFAPVQTGLLLPGKGTGLGLIVIVDVALDVQPKADVALTV